MSVVTMTEDETTHCTDGIGRTSEPVRVEWTGGLDEPQSVEVNPYTGKIIVNGREFDLNSLCNDETPDWMYQSVEPGSDTEGER